MINLNLELRKTSENILNKNKIGFDYKPYSERVNNVLLYLNKMLSTKFTEFLNFPIFSLKGYHSFKGIEIEKIYNIDLLENFMGNIPLKNQEEIIRNLEILQKNPFLQLIKVQGYNRPQLFVLAPKNNFATENNESGIDPIVFAHCIINNEQYLIPITQWN